MDKTVEKKPAQRPASGDAEYRRAMRAAGYGDGAADFMDKPLSPDDYAADGPMADLDRELGLDPKTL